MVSSSGGVVGGVIPGVQRLCGGQNLEQYFNAIGFGMNQVFHVLQTANLDSVGRMLGLGINWG